MAVTRYPDEVQTQMKALYIHRADQNESLQLSTTKP